MARLFPPSSGPLQLRRATLDDIEEFVTITMAAFEYDESEIAQRRQDTAEQFRDPDHHSYIADLNGKPISGLEVFPVPRESRVFINSLGVLPDHQRQGYG